MKLKSFNIKNIKSIINSGTCHLASDNITIFAGQNESGKSAVLEALRYFSKGMDENFQKYSKRIDKRNPLPCVECCFSLCDDTDFEYEDENIGIVLKELKEIQCYREEENDIEFSSDTKTKLNEIISQLSKSHKITNIAEASPLDENTENTPVPNITIEEFAKQVEDSVLKYLPTFDYYNSFNNILPEKIAISEIANNEAVQDFQTVFNIDLAQYVEMQTNIKVQKKKDVVKAFDVDFNECWTQKLTNLDDSKYELILEDKNNEIEFLIDRGTNIPLYLVQKSTGFKWFLSFYLRLQALKTKIESQEIENYILLIDEPGQGLHEKAQDDVKKVLEELAGKSIQILYTTHNPRLIEVGDKITRLRLIYQDKVEGTKINNLSQMASKGTKQSQDALSPIVTAMGLINMTCMDLSNNKNVIVEGITDKYYLEAFSNLLNISFTCNIIPSTGHENVKNIASILLGWGYDFKVIIDGGEGRNPKENKTERLIREKLFANDDIIIKNKIKRLKQCAIEDCFSVQDFTNYVKPQEIDRADEEINSALAKRIGKKELWARLFIEKVNNGEIKQKDFAQETLDNFGEILNWLQS